MYYLTDEQFAEIEAAAENSTSGYPYADRYAKIFEIIQQPDAFGNLAPNNVIAWFGAAAQANRGVGGASDFIRDYTQIQLEIRTGGTVSGIESVLQNASNAIAIAVFEDISDNIQTIGGKIYFALPTALEIGANDATKAMAELSAFDSDPGIWSGNPLFLGLGEASFWNQNIIGTAGETYDLFTSSASFISAGISTFLNGGTGDLLNLFWSQGQEGRVAAASTVSGAYSTSNAFLTDAYGGYLDAGLAQFLVRDVVVGSAIADHALEEASLLTNNTLMHAGAGNDTLIGSLGNDLLDGGTGNDDLATFEALSAVTPLQFQVTLDRITSAAQFSAEVLAEGVQSALFNIEELHLGIGNDTLMVRELSGITTGLNTINALSEETDGDFYGDTINLSQAVYSGGTVSLADETVSMNNTAYTLNVINFENAVGTSFGDTIEGSASNNILYGGDGADSLSGGAGDDILIFDAEDTLVEGGAGRDVGIVSGEAGVTIDLAATGLEVVVGGAGADNFTLDSTGSAAMMAAGGAGVDTFTVNSGATPGSTGPTVVWGGEGADVFNINGSDDFSHGILTVNVEGLTAENFADFDLDMLGLGNDFNWDAIDMVVLNPDSSDQFFVNGEQVGVEAGSISVYQVEPSEPGEATQFTLVGSQGMDLRFGGDNEAVGIFDATFLNNGTLSIQTSVGVDPYDSVMQPIDPETGEIFPLADLTGEEDDTWADAYHLGSADFTQTFSFYIGDYDVSPGEQSIGHYWIRFESANGTVDNLSEVSTFGSLDDVRAPWFVVGGTFGNLSLSGNGSISVTMPEDSAGFSVTDWLASVTGSGGTGGPSSNNTNVSAGSGTTTVLTFSTGTSSITYDGTAVNPTNPPNGVSLAQAGANVEVDFGGGDVVILENVSLTEWQAAAATQYFGSATGETLTGTTQDEVFSSGAGNDLIIAGSGDDTINYVSGDDVIKGHRSNYGNDTLDLSQYTADQVSFRIVGHDVFIDTPDGTIELDYQVRYEVGHARTNIENIIFSDGTLDDAAIRDRAISDQTTAGDDVVTGSSHADTISSGAGNDIIYAGSGDDTIIYTSGDDVIIGNNTGNNYGNDTLDLSQYTADQVSFRIAGHDVFIDTPDGTIELDYQVRYDLGHTSSNIESIIFSDGTLDDAAIRDRAIADQTSAGDDVVTGSFQTDTISSGAGDDIIFAGSGDDTIIYTSGDDVIIGNSMGYNYGNDTLDLSQYTADQVNFRIVGHDVFIDTPDGSIELDYQVRNDLGHTRSNIENIIFSDGTLDEAGIAARAIADQASGGDDVITGSYQSEVITGGAGNDTLSGVSGSDTFVFAVGDGIDVITDYDAANDALEFTGINFSDLTITQTGSDVLIEYGTGDQVLITGAGIDMFTEPEFLFA